MPVHAVPQRLRYQRMADEVADVLRRMILSGELGPGERVTQEDLAAMLGVSTMPVREALLKLTASGLVEASPNRSFRVVRTTTDDVRDSYWMHAMLAGELTRRACEREGKGLAPELRTLEQRYVTAAKDGNLEQLEEANWLLHRSINQAAKSPKLLFMLKATLKFIPDGWYPQISGWVSMSEAAHDDIISAFENNDPNAAAKAAADHVFEAGQMLIAHFSKTGHWAKGTTPKPV